MPASRRTLLLSLQVVFLVLHLLWNLDSLLAMQLLLYFLLVFFSLRTSWVRPSVPLEKSSAPQEDTWRRPSRKSNSILTPSNISMAITADFMPLRQQQLGPEALCFHVVRPSVHPVRVKVKSLDHLEGISLHAGAHVDLDSRIWFW